MWLSAPSKILLKLMTTCESRVAFNKLRKAIYQNENVLYSKDLCSWRFENLSIARSLRGTENLAPNGRHFGVG